MTVADSVARLRALLADPQAGTHGKPANDGDRADYRHWLYDADPDFELPPLTDQEAS